jgi:hypothetical protein
MANGRLRQVVEIFYSRRCALALSVLILVTGCNHGPTMLRVGGKVQYKDGSVPTGGVRVVRFEPSHSGPNEGLRVASGQIENDGSYELFTKRPGDGVMPGTYNVTFTIWKGPHEPVSLISEKYTASASTPFKDVKVDRGRDDLNFEIEPLDSSAGTAQTTGHANH